MLGLGTARARLVVAFMVCGLPLASPAAGLGQTGAPAGHAMTPAVKFQGHYTPLGNFSPLGLAPFPCQQSDPAQCYGPDQVRAAYGIQPLLDARVTGSRRTIVIVEAFQSPSVQSDLAAFDAIWHLPAPPRFSILFPNGATPFDMHDPTQIGWALETAADVEWAHAIAPGAAIDLVFARSQSDVDLLSAVEYAVNHRLGDVISQSYGEAENCAAPGILARQHAVYQRAVAIGITVLASSGDQGATQPTCDGAALQGTRAVATPASDPDVTAVGGTVLLANGTTGAYAGEAGWVASGGGFSEFFKRPAYQAAARTGSDRRGVPDVSYDAGVGVLVVWSLLAPPGRIGFGVIGGTSLGSPQWAGIIALVDQRAGRRLGAVNAILYRLARSHKSAGLHDVVSGNNSFGGATGFSARSGWDAVTGLGTPNVARLVRDLATAGRE
jgi:subtilase family serine protease